MRNPRLATRYAKSLLDLTIEKNSLDDTLGDMKLIDTVCCGNPDFVNMLCSPIISSTKKVSILNAIFKTRINEISFGFINLLVTKGRESNLPEIAGAFISQYNELKHIKLVKLKTATPLDEATKKAILSKVATFLPNDTINLSSEVDESLIGGFVLQVEDKLFDASVKKSLADIKSKIVDYSYVSKI